MDDKGTLEIGLWKGHVEKFFQKNYQAWPLPIYLASGPDERS